MRPPDIENSTKEERQAVIREMFKCIADCDSCGLCKVFRGKEPEIAYEDYIEGKRSFLEISMEYR
ncbi:MAG: hypothetical protein IJ137_04670 [Eubacterium sp.]|nr:hypothetical protein [Eubacterium sp.]